jgi:alpha-beta hydrolase superfamily lysophospholipase
VVGWRWWRVGETHPLSVASACCQPCDVDPSQTLQWEPDELAGFRKITHILPAEDDGELCATLVASEETLARSDGPTVLYLHGFVDYFFQVHLARAFEQAGFRFLALDLRRHGRSLRPLNRPCYARHVDEFFSDIDWAIAEVQAKGQLSVVAHSTGGLIASVYAARGNQRSSIARLLLNSPFLRFPTRTAWLRAKLAFGRRVGRLLPKLALPQELSGVYGMTIHASQHGEWTYDLAKKPLRGFSFYAGWSTMITDAQSEVERGLGLSIPVLVLHAARSHATGRLPEPEDFRSDTVLRVEDMAELAPRLGSRVTLVAIEDGLHDLTLSPPGVRHAVLERMVDFARG